METTSLDALMREDGVSVVPGGLCLVVLPAWIVAGEERLSYTTFVRLVECCREHHWRTDVLPHAGVASIDSITKSFTCRFLAPMLAYAAISISWRVMDVRAKGYTLHFQARDVASETTCAECDMVSVFYDVARWIPAAPPPAVRARLESLMASAEASATRPLTRG